MAAKRTGLCFMCVIILVCVRQTLLSTFVTELKQRTFIWMQWFACELPTNTDVLKFYLNISVDTETDTSQFRFQFGFQNGDVALINKSSDGLWYLTASSRSHDPPLISVSFDLSTTNVEGNCTWYLEYGSNNSSIEDYGNSSQTPGQENSTADPQTVTQNMSTYCPDDDVNTTVTQSPSNATFDSSSHDYDVTTIEPLTSTSNASVTDATPHVDATCLCPCPCPPTSQETVAVMIEEIIKDLHIDRNSTGLAKRKRLSASDKRWLSRGIGWCGVLVLTAVFGLILVGDAKLLLRDAMVMVHDLKRKFC